MRREQLAILSSSETGCGWELRKYEMRFRVILRVWRQLLDKFRQPVPDAFVPLLGNIESELPNAFRVEQFRPVEGRFKRVPASDRLIDTVVRVDPAKREIREGPFPCVEALALIDECGGIPFAL